MKRLVFLVSDVAALKNLPFKTQSLQIGGVYSYYKKSVSVLTANLYKMEIFGISIVVNQKNLINSTMDPIKITINLSLIRSLKILCKA